MTQTMQIEDGGSRYRLADACLRHALLEFVHVTSSPGGES